MTERDEALAMRRNLAIFAIRIIGVAFIMAGFALIADRIDVLDYQGDRILGAVLVIVGALDYALVPHLLVRQWKGPRV